MGRKNEIYGKENKQVGGKSRPPEHSPRTKYDQLNVFEHAALLFFFSFFIIKVTYFNISSGRLVIHPIESGNRRLRKFEILKVLLIRCHTLEKNEVKRNIRGKRYR